MEENSSIDMPKMKLSICVEMKKFLLILDDMWSAMDLTWVEKKKFLLILDDMWSPMDLTCVEKKKFLLILDDMWSPMDLKRVRVKFGEKNSSKVLVSSSKVLE